MIYQGQLKDQNGNAVSAAVVHIWEPAGGNDYGSTPMQTTTDAGGNWKLPYDMDLSGFGISFEKGNNYSFVVPIEQAAGSSFTLPVESPAGFPWWIVIIIGGLVLINHKRL